MNRIVIILRFDLLGPATIAPAFVNKTSGLLRRRHVSGNYFAGNLAGRPVNRRSPDRRRSGNRSSHAAVAALPSSAGRSVEPLLGPVAPNWQARSSRRRLFDERAVV